MFTYLLWSHENFKVCILSAHENFRDIQQWTLVAIDDYLVFWWRLLPMYADHSLCLMTFKNLLIFELLFYGDSLFFRLLTGRVLDKNWSTKEETLLQWKNYQMTLTQVWHFPLDKKWATLEFDFKVWEEVIYSVEDNLS